jgi:hypothetical protein
MVFIVFILNICPKSISGWWYTYPKSMSSSVGVTIPKIWKVIKKMFQATNQIWNSSRCLQATPLLASKRSFSAVPLAPANNGPEHWCRKPVFGGCQCCDVATFTRIGLVRICDSNIPIFWAKFIFLSVLGLLSFAIYIPIHWESVHKDH